MPEAQEKTAAEIEGSPAPANAGKRESADEQLEFTFGQRIKIWLAGALGYLAVLLIGRSLRWEVCGRENYEAARRVAKSFMVTFWHCGIFSAIWYWRQRGMVVMVSQNFDGEYTSNVIHGHGYATARGSSSRRASRVVVEMIRALREGREAAITPDGPRGPRWVAKPGVVQIAKYSGAAILCFHITPQRAWALRRSWDQSEIPKPFSRTAIFIAPPILVSPDADEAEQARKLQEVQAALDEMRQRGEAWKAALETRNTASRQ